MYMPHTTTNRGRKLELRPFVFIDGEAVRHEYHTDDDPSSYALIGASTGERLQAQEISTEQAFAFLITLKERHPTALFVGFGFKYDVNMMCKDIPVLTLKERIRKAKRTRWKQYTILYMPGKRFQITDRYKHITFMISDVITFFQCSFVSNDGITPGACELYLGWDDPRLLRIRAGKKLRNVFRWDEMNTLIEPYMTLELELGVMLMEQLRDYLFVTGIRPRGWHGPGAIASALLTREGIRKAMKAPHRKLMEWSRHAYFGGRFEQMKTGYYDRKVWQYDIRSAYPFALTHCPDLSRGTWTLRKEPTNNGSQFKLYALRFHNSNNRLTSWNPLPLRSMRQTIHYQNHVNGMYWGPEAEIVLRAFPDQVEIVGVLEFDDDGTRPFAFINEMYEQRMVWKAEGNPAQLANKLGMNSLYGKLAQRVGWNEVDGTAPPSHQLEWAGFTTSYCRAMMLELMLQNPESVIALETDGLFSAEPLVVNAGEALGQYEVEIWDGLIYVQSGVYFKKSGEEWKTSKTRGFGKNTLPAQDALDHAIGLESMMTEQNRFVGMAYADSENWRKFLPHPHLIQWGGNGKRVHDARHCSGCEVGSTWHDTIFVSARTMESHPHTLPWVDGYSNPYQIAVDHSEDEYE